jgi:hypothetical protein
MVDSVALINVTLAEHYSIGILDERPARGFSVHRDPRRKPASLMSEESFGGRFDVLAM